MEGFVVDQVSKTYMDENQRPFQVLHNVAFSWSSGENIAVLGESGSGKSTLARLLIGIEKPNSGTITWNGEDITRWKASTWREPEQAKERLPGKETERGKRQRKAKRTGEERPFPGKNSLRGFSDSARERAWRPTRAKRLGRRSREAPQSRRKCSLSFLDIDKRSDDGQVRAHAKIPAV